MRKYLLLLQTRSYGFLSAAFVPLAQDAYRNTRLATLYDSSQSLSTYLNSVFMIAISVGATIAVFRLAYAGYLRMGGGMWDSIDSRKKVKEMIRDVFIGLFLLLSVWIVLHQINPNILKLDFIFEAINIGAGTAPAATGAGGTPSGARRNLTISGGPCAPNTAVFGSSQATQMSCICGAESGGTVNRPSDVDRTVDGRPISTGLYQINLSANPVSCPNQPPLNCRPAFSGVLGTCSTCSRQVRVVDENLYAQCIAAANRRECNEATAAGLLNNSRGLNNWSAWSSGNQSTCI